jgi:hypothetical protein
MVCAALLAPVTTWAQDDQASLIANGDFVRGMSYWVRDQPCADCSITVQPEAYAGSPALAWERTNSGSVGSAVSAWQPLDFDVKGYGSLWLSMKVLVERHTLPNSGWWSDQNAGSGEYPVKVSLTFLDEQGQSFEWAYGFMITHDGATALRNFFIEPGGEWSSFETDVFDASQWLGPLGQPLPRPVHLTRITVGGSGWDFKGAVANLSLTGTAGDTSGGGSTGSDGTSGDQTTGGDGADDQLGDHMGDQTVCAPLTAEEYPIVSAAEDQPSHFEYRDRLTDAILGVRRSWREPDSAVKVDAANRAINPFGYLLAADAGGTTYTLYYHDSVLVSDVSSFYPVAVNSSGTDFRLLLDTVSQPATLIVMPETVANVDTQTFFWIAPVYAGDDLVEVEVDWNAGLFYVRRAGQVVYTVTPSGPFVEPPVKALWSWDGHWVLEVDGTVLVDGESLNAQLGYDEIFGWQLIAGCPFYFFKQNGQIGVSYGGQTLPYTYQDVAHYMCCEPSMFNLSGNGTMVWFHALRDGMWYYVEMGAYPTQ